MTGLVRRCSLVLALGLAFTAGEIHGMGILPEGTPVVLLAVAALIAGVNHAANALTRAERRQLGRLAKTNRRLARRTRLLGLELAATAGDRDLWKARCFAHVQKRVLMLIEIRALRHDLDHRRATEKAAR